VIQAGDANPGAGGRDETPLRLLTSRDSATVATTSARRLLAKRRRREARFAANVNHTIAKTIVAEAARTGRGVAVEELTGIRERVRLRKPQRVTLSSWAFHQLGAFLSYKARRAGVPLIQVAPRYTSQTCHGCGYRDKRNRPDQETFICRSCGVVAHADHNAAHNIAQRGAEGWGAVNRPHAAPLRSQRRG